MKINEVEQLVGITKRNIRFYEKEGLLTPGRNADNGYRNYDDGDVEVLRKIKLLRKLDVPMEEIRKMQQGALTLTDGLRRHMIQLEREQENLATIRSLCQAGALNVVLSHRPSLMAEYARSGAHLVFSGHAHGGQVRLPLVGPLFAPDEGALPDYTAGMYQAGDTQVVVSRGLGNGTPFPRLWNPPELVVVTCIS